MSPPRRLTVFITGASRGLGRELAREYARRGANLGLVARAADALDELADELVQQHGVRCLARVADVRDPASMWSVARYFMDEFGVPDRVIANAGVSTGTLTECAEDYAAFQQVLAINVLGMVATFAPFVPRMKANGQGTLVGVASVAGVRGLPGAGAYSASKAAAIRYLESLRVELRPARLRVVTLCPGYIDTDMTKGNPYPMPFLLRADDAARRLARAIERGRSYAVIPWPMALTARVLALLPNAVYDRLFVYAGRKPRGRPL